MKILDLCFLVLSVSLLCVLVTTAPAGQSDDGSSPTVDKAVVTKNDTTLKNSTTTAKNETSVATPTNATTTNTTTVSNDTQETTPISQAEMEKYTIEPSSSTKRDDKPKPKSDRYLLYEVEKDIRNLSLDNVNYIIDMGPDVLAYSLLDKLGYREGDIEDDPHLKVIEDNKDKLDAKLKVRRKELTPVTKPPLPSTEPPPRVTTTHVIDVTKIKYEIMKRIKALSLVDIDNLLDVYEDETLPFALGIGLGYDDDRDVEHFQYLEDLGGERLREKLLAELEKKSNVAPPPPPKAKPEQNDRLSDKLNDGRTASDELNVGDGSDRNQDDSNLGLQDGTSNKESESPDGRVPIDDHNDRSQGPPSSKNQDANSDDKDNNEQTKDEDIPSDLDDDLDSAGIVPGHDQKMPEFEKGGENTEPKGSSLDKSDADISKGPAGGETQKDEGDEKEGKGPSQPGGNSDNTLEEADEEYDEYMDEKSSGGFGAWHFLIIFIVIGVAVVIGYLCVHNRKKLREGVESYVSDASKRRRRAREYKPLATT